MSGLEDKARVIEAIAGKEISDQYRAICERVSSIKSPRELPAILQQSRELLLRVEEMREEKHRIFEAKFDAWKIELPTATPERRAEILKESEALLNQSRAMREHET